MSVVKLEVNQDPHFELRDIRNNSPHNYTIECIVNGVDIWNVLINKDTPVLNKAVEDLWQNSDDSSAMKILIQAYQEEKCL